MLAPNRRNIEVPQQPIIIRHKAIEFAIPLSRQFPVQLFDKGQQRSLWRKPLFVIIDWDVLTPPKTLSIRSKSETIEEVLPADKWHIPQMRNPPRVFLNRNLHFEPL